MKLRRISQQDRDELVYQVWTAQGWIDAMSVPDYCTITPPVYKHASTSKTAQTVSVLPITPLSFRDFMLYEQHVIAASRGYVRRFMPQVFALSRAYERLSGRIFPAFKPNQLWYQQPIYYMSNHLTFVPSGTPIHCPRYSQALDYELELGVVLGQPLFNATPEQALAAIGGFVVLNDFSARDVQRAEMNSGFGPQKAKHFCSSMSEVLVTADELIGKIDALSASIWINGKQVVATSTAGMFHSLGQALAHASKDEPLFAGELFGTGTLPNGSGMENGHWLKTGDVLRLVIDGVGEIEHHIVAYADVSPIS